MFIVHYKYQRKLKVINVFFYYSVNHLAFEGAV